MFLGKQILTIISIMISDAIFPCRLDLGGFCSDALNLKVKC